MKNHTHTASALLVAVLTAATAAQVDNRVQPLQPVPGRARDANNQVGSGGFNAQSNAGAYINSANAVMSGNVYGLGGFHYTNSSSLLGGGNSFGAGSLGTLGSLSSVGVRNSFNTTALAGYNTGSVNNPYLFKASLPSADISYFNRQAFSVSDARQIQPTGGSNYYIPGAYQPYYANSNTVLNSGAVQSGLNRAGTTGLDTPFTPLFQGPLSTYGSTPQTLPDGVRDPQDRRLQPLNQPVGSPPQMSIFGSAAADVPNWQRPYVDASQSPIFGPSGVDARLPAALAGGQFTARAGQSNLGDADYAQARADEAAKAAAAAAPPTGGLTAIGPTAGALTPQATLGQPQDTTRLGPKVAALSPERLGVDRFADMAMAVREAEAAAPDFITELTQSRAGGNARVPGAAAVGPGPAAAGPAAVGPTLPEQPGGKGGTSETGRDTRTATGARLDQAARWAQELLKAPMKSFVGRGDNAVNLHLAAAEAAMKSGDYYAAAGEFGLASSLAPNNPLPLLGRGNALAAAGDYMSAVLFITRGISRFPGIVAFDLDLPTLIGGQDVFDVRRADLEKQLARVDSYELRFLLGYLEYYSGLRDVGMKNLRAAAAKAPAGSVIAVFPGMLAGATAPASK